MNTYNKHCLLLPTTIHKVHTAKCITTQQAEKNTVPVNGFKQFDITSVASKKANLLQHHENTRVTTRAKTVTMHLVTHKKDFTHTQTEKNTKIKQPAKYTNMSGGSNTLTAPQSIKFRQCSLQQHKITSTKQTYYKVKKNFQCLSFYQQGK